MKVLERAVTPDGIEIQLEDWRDKENVLNRFTIGAYPIAKNSSKFGWVRKGEKFRLSIPINQYKNYFNENLLLDYEALKDGSKKIEDLAEHFWNAEIDMWFLGMKITGKER